MEGGRGPPRGYELEVSFPNPQTMHHDMGFVPLEENHGPSFMVTSQSSPFPLPQVSVPFNSPITFSGDLISKPWNHDQVKSSEELLHKDVIWVVLEPSSLTWVALVCFVVVCFYQMENLEARHVGEQNCTSDVGNSWYA